MSAAGFLLRVLLAVAAAVLVDGLGVALSGRPRVFNPFLVLTVWFAMRGKKAPAMAAGALLGLAQDALGSVVFGVSYLTKVVAAYAVSLACGRLTPGHALTSGVLIAGATLVELCVLAATGFLLGQDFESRSFGQLAAHVAANVLLGTFAFGLLRRLQRRRDARGDGASRARR